MFEIIIGTAFTFFAVVGFAEILRALKVWLYLPAPQEETFLLTVKGHDETVEYRVRSLICRAGAMGCRSALLLIVVEGADEETERVCRLLERDEECVRVLGVGELPGLFVPDV